METTSEDKSNSFASSEYGDLVENEFQPNTVSLEAVGDWVEYEDSNSGRPYYVDKNNPRRVTWTKPTHLSITSSESSQFQEPQVESWQPSQQDQAATPDSEDYPSIENRLKNTWVQLFDVNSNEYYYANALTKRTTWSRPVGNAVLIISSNRQLEVSSKIANDSHISTPDNVHDIHEMKLQNTEESNKGSDPKIHTLQTKKERISNITFGVNDGETSGDLMQYHHLGQTYYVNPVDGDTSCDPDQTISYRLVDEGQLPNARYSNPFVPIMDPEHSSNASHSSSHTGNMPSLPPMESAEGEGNCVDISCREDLQNNNGGWRQRLDSTSKQIYFIREDTGVTTWIQPSNEQLESNQYAENVTSNWAQQKLMENRKNTDPALADSTQNYQQYQEPELPSSEPLSTISHEARQIRQQNTSHQNSRQVNLSDFKDPGNGERAKPRHVNCPRQPNSCGPHEYQSKSMFFPAATTPSLREEIWQVDVGDLDGTLVKDISEIKDFSMQSLAKHMKLAAMLFSKRRNAYNLRKAILNIIEIAEHPQPDTWAKIKSTHFISWLLRVLSDTAVCIVWPEALKLLCIMSEQADSRYLLIREARIWDLIFQRFLRRMPVAQQSISDKCVIQSLTLLLNFLKDDQEIFSFFVYQSDGVRLFLNIQKNFRSPQMTNMVECILNHAFKGPVNKNALLMRVSPMRLFEVLHSNMMHLFPKLSMTSFSSLDFGITWNKRHVVLGPNCYLFEYAVNTRNTASFVPSDACATYMVDLRTTAASEIAINRIDGIHHYGLQLKSSFAADHTVYTLAISGSDRMQEWLHICQEITQSSKRLSVGSSYNRGVLLAKTQEVHASSVVKKTGNTQTHSLNSSNFFIRRKDTQPGCGLLVNGVNISRKGAATTKSNVQSRKNETKKNRNQRTESDQTDSFEDDFQMLIEVPDQATRHRHYFNVDHYQAIWPQSFKTSARRGNSHCHDMIDLLCTYVDIIDSRNGSELQTAVLAFNLLTLFLSGSNAVSNSEKVLQSGRKMVFKAFRAIDLALSQLSTHGFSVNIGKNFDSHHEHSAESGDISMKDMGHLIFPLSRILNEQKHGVNASADKAPVQITHQGNFENVTEDGTILPPAFSPTRSRNSFASNIEGISALNADSKAIMACELVVAAELFLIALFTLPNKAVTMSRITKEHYRTLMHLLHFKHIDILTLTCHVLQFCTKSLLVLENCIPHNESLISTLSRLRFPEELLQFDPEAILQADSQLRTNVYRLPEKEQSEMKGIMHNMDTTSPVAVHEGATSTPQSPDTNTMSHSPESHLTSALIIEGKTYGFFSEKMRIFQVSLLQRSLAIIFMVCKKHRLIEVDITALVFILKSDVAPAVLVSLRTMLERCQSIRNTQDRIDLLNIAVPHIGSLLSKKIDDVGDTTSLITALAKYYKHRNTRHKLQANDLKRQDALSLLARRTRSTAIAILLSLLPLATEEQKQVYCSNGLITILVNLMRQESILASDNGTWFLDLQCRQFSKNCSSSSFHNSNNTIIADLTHEQDVLSNIIASLEGLNNHSICHILKDSLEGCRYDGASQMMIIPGILLFLLVNRQKQLIGQYLIAPHGHSLVFELLNCLQDKWVRPKAKVVIAILLREVVFENVENQRIVGDIGGVEISFSVLRSLQMGLNSDDRFGLFAKNAMREPRHGNDVMNGIINDGLAPENKSPKRNSTGDKRNSSEDFQSSKINGSGGMPGSIYVKTDTRMLYVAILLFLLGLCDGCLENVERVFTAQYLKLLFSIAKSSDLFQTTSALDLINVLFRSSEHKEYPSACCKYGNFLITTNPGYERESFSHNRSLPRSASGPNVIISSSVAIRAKQQRKTVGGLRTRRKVIPGMVTSTTNNQRRCAFLQWLVDQSNSTYLPLAKAAHQHLILLGGLHHYLHGYGRSPRGTSFVLFSAKDLHILIQTQSISLRDHVSSALPRWGTSLCTSEEVLKDKPLLKLQSDGNNHKNFYCTEVIQKQVQDIDPKELRDVRSAAILALLLRLIIGQRPSFKAIRDFGQVSTEMQLSILGRGHRFSPWIKMRFILKLMTCGGMPVLMLYGYKIHRKFRHYQTDCGSSDMDGLHDFLSHDSVMNDVHQYDSDIDNELNDLSPAFMLLLHCPAYGIQCELQTRDDATKSWKGKIRECTQTSHIDRSRKSSCSSCCRKVLNVVPRVFLLKIDRYICNANMQYLNPHPQFRNFVFALQATDNVSFKKWLVDPQWQVCKRRSVKPSVDSYFTMLDGQGAMESPDVKQMSMINCQCQENSVNGSNSISIEDEHVDLSSEQKFQDPNNYNEVPLTTSHICESGVHEIEAEEHIACGHSLKSTMQANTFEDEFNSDMNLESMDACFFNHDWSVQSVLSTDFKLQSEVSNIEQVRNQDVGNCAENIHNLPAQEKISSDRYQQRSEDIQEIQLEQNEANANAEENKIGDVNQFSLRSMSDYGLHWQSVTTTQLDGLLGMINWETGTKMTLLVMQVLEIIFSHIPVRLMEKSWWSISCRDESSSVSVSRVNRSDNSSDNIITKNPKSLEKETDHIRHDDENRRKISKKYLKSIHKAKDEDFRKYRGPPAAQSSVNIIHNTRNDMSNVSFPHSTISRCLSSYPVSQRLQWMENFDGENIVATLMKGLEMCHWCGESDHARQNRLQLLQQCLVFPPNQVCSKNYQQVTCKTQPTHESSSNKVNLFSHTKKCLGTDSSYPPGLCYEVRIPLNSSGNDQKIQYWRSMALLLTQRTSLTSKGVVDMISKDDSNSKSEKFIDTDESSTQNINAVEGSTCISYWTLKDIQCLNGQNNAKLSNQNPAAKSVTPVISVNDRLVRVGSLGLPRSCSTKLMREIFTMSCEQACAQARYENKDQAYLSLLLVSESSETKYEENNGRSEYTTSFSSNFSDLTDKSSVVIEKCDYCAPRVIAAYECIQTQNIVIRTLRNLCTCVAINSSRDLRFYHQYFPLMRLYIMEHPGSVDYFLNLCAPPSVIQEEINAAYVRQNVGLQTNFWQLNLSTMIATFEVITALCEPGHQGFTVLTTSSSQNERSYGKSKQATRRQRSKNYTRHSCTIKKGTNWKSKRIQSSHGVIKYSKRFNSMTANSESLLSKSKSANATLFTQLRHGLDGIHEVKKRTFGQNDGSTKDSKLHYEPNNEVNNHIDSTRGKRSSDSNDSIDFKMCRDDGVDVENANISQNSLDAALPEVGLDELTINIVELFSEASIVSKVGKSLLCWLERYSSMDDDKLKDLIVLRLHLLQTYFFLAKHSNNATKILLVQQGFLQQLLEVRTWFLHTDSILIQDATEVCHGTSINLVQDVDEEMTHMATFEEFECPPSNVSTKVRVTRTRRSQGDLLVTITLNSFLCELNSKKVSLSWKQCLSLLNSSLDYSEVHSRRWFEHDQTISLYIDDFVPTILDTLISIHSSAGIWNSQAGNESELRATHEFLTFLHHLFNYLIAHSAYLKVNFQCEEWTASPDSEMTDDDLTTTNGNMPPDITHPDAHRNVASKPAAIPVLSAKAKNTFKKVRRICTDVAAALRDLALRGDLICRILRDHDTRKICFAILKFAGIRANKTCEDALIVLFSTYIVDRSKHHLFLDDVSLEFIDDDGDTHKSKQLRSKQSQIQRRVHQGSTKHGLFHVAEIATIGGCVKGFEHQNETSKTTEHHVSTPDNKLTLAQNDLQRTTSTELRSQSHKFSAMDLFLSLTSTVSPAIMELCSQIFEQISFSIGSLYYQRVDDRARNESNLVMTSSGKVIKCGGDKEHHDDVQKEKKESLRKTEKENLRNAAAIEAELQLLAMAKRLVGWMYFVPVAHLRAQQRMSRTSCRDDQFSNANDTNKGNVRRGKNDSNEHIGQTGALFSQYTSAIASICAALCSICSLNDGFVEYVAGHPGFFVRLATILELRESGSRLGTQSSGGIYEQVCRLMIILGNSYYNKVKISKVPGINVPILLRLCSIAMEPVSTSVRGTVVELLHKLLGISGYVSSDSGCRIQSSTRVKLSDSTKRFDLKNEAISEHDSQTDCNSGACENTVNSEDNCVQKTYSDLEKHSNHDFGSRKVLHSEDSILSSCNVQELIAMIKLVQIPECRNIVWHASVQLANRLEWDVYPTAASISLMDKSGWLLRRTSSHLLIGQKWVRRWYVIRTPHLFEFLGRKGKKASVLKRKILLTGCNVNRIEELGKQALQLSSSESMEVTPLVLAHVDVAGSTTTSIDDWLGEIRDGITRSNELTGRQPMSSMIFQFEGGDLSPISASEVKFSSQDARSSCKTDDTMSMDLGKCCEGKQIATSLSHLNSEHQECSRCSKSDSNLSVFSKKAASSTHKIVHSSLTRRSPNYGNCKPLKLGSNSTSNGKLSKYGRRFPRSPIAALIKVSTSATSSGMP